jgi:hypothetical protein
MRIAHIRYIYTGNLLADSAVFITCATIASVLDISKAVEAGVVIEPILEHSPGAVTYATNLL